MARVVIPYEDSISLATSGMSYAEWRQALIEQGQDVQRTYRRARTSGDLQFYNATLPDGSVEVRIALRGEAIPQEG